VNPVHVLDEVALRGTEGRGKHHRGQVTAAAPECHAFAVGPGRLEAGDDGHDVLVEQFAQ